MWRSHGVSLILYSSWSQFTSLVSSLECTLQLNQFTQLTGSRGGWWLIWACRIRVVSMIEMIIGILIYWVAEGGLSVELNNLVWLLHQRFFTYLKLGRRKFGEVFVNKAIQFLIII